MLLEFLPSAISTYKETSEKVLNLRVLAERFIFRFNEQKDLFLNFHPVFPVYFSILRQLLSQNMFILET